jgi:hypothetical protein
MVPSTKNLRLPARKRQSEIVASQGKREEEEGR